MLDRWRRHLALTTYLAISACLLGLATTHADDWSRFGHPNEQLFAEREVLQSMWRLQLFSIAEQQCSTQRALTQLGSDPYAHWTLWWIETLSQQAIHQLSDRDAILTKIDELCESFVQERSNERRKYWVEWHRLLARLAIARSHLAEFLAAPTRSESRDAAIQLVRSTIDDCERLRPEIDRVLALSANPSRDRELVAPSTEVQTLLNEWLLLKADAIWVRTQCYPRGHADTVAFGTEMLTAVEEASRRISKDWVGWPRLEIYRCNALIYSEQFTEAERRLKSLLQLPLSAGLYERVTVMLSECYRLQGDFASAGKTMSGLAAGDAGPEAALERLEIVIASGADPTAWANAIAMKDAIGVQYGPYWKLRAEAAIVGRSRNQASPSSGNLKTTFELITVEVAQLLAADRLVEAIERLQQAERLAIEQGAEEAFPFGLRIAALLQKQGRLDDAAEKFATVAFRHSDNPKASASHAMAVWLDTERLRSQTSDNSEAWSVLRKRLERQIQQWPSDRHAHAARVQLDQLLLRRGETEAATKLWIAAVEQTHGSEEQYLAFALSRLGLLAVIRRSSSPAPEPIPLAEELAKALNEIGRTDDRLGSVTAELGKAILLDIVRDDRWFSLDGGVYSVALGPTQTSSNAMRELIDRFLELKEAARREKQLPPQAEREVPITVDMEWILIGHRLLNDARLGVPPNPRDSERWLSSDFFTTEANTFNWLPALDAIANVVFDARSTVRIAWLDFLTRACNSIELEHVGVGGSSGERIQVRLLTIKAITALLQDSSRDAASHFEALEKQFPRNPNVAIGKAMAIRDLDHVRAIRFLQKLAGGVPAGSPWWWEARCRTAQIYMLQGQRQDADTLIQLALATYPNGPDVWLSRMQKLKGQSAGP